jgi:cytochrome c556
MDAMEAIGSANKTLSNIARNRVDFDLGTVTDAATKIAEHSGEPLLELFVEGTDGGVSDAKPEIWSKWEDFSRLTLELNSSAVSLSQITSEEEFANAYKAVSNTCGSCHRAYRAKR